MTNTVPSTRNLPRSMGALFLGFLVAAGLSLGTDELLHVLDVYPPWGQAMHAPALNLLALSYRIVYGVLGGYIAARFAPRNPMRHALILGAAGGVVSLAGVIVAINLDMGPSWYPIALVITAIPCAWLGGILQRRNSSR